MIFVVLSFRSDVFIRRGSGIFAFPELTGYRTQESTAVDTAVRRGKCRFFCSSVSGALCSADQTRRFLPTAIKTVNNIHENEEIRETNVVCSLRKCCLFRILPARWLCSSCSTNRCSDGSCLSSSGLRTESSWSRFNPSPQPTKNSSHRFTSHSFRFSCPHSQWNSTAFQRNIESLQMPFGEAVTWSLQVLQRWKSSSNSVPMQLLSEELPDVLADV